MNQLIKIIEELDLKLTSLEKSLNLSSKRTSLKGYKEQQLAVDFWQDKEEAVRVSKEIENLSDQINVWQSLRQRLAEVSDLIKLVEDDEESLLDLEGELEVLENEVRSLEFLSLFSGEHDNSSAYLFLQAGAGGTDAQDWTEMLERMYLRFSERQGWQVKVLDHHYGSEAGLKSVTLQISGPWVYGHLKSENGVHRLLRNSPFNADGLRQTSFASVEVIPELTNEEIEIKDGDVKIDVFRSSGPGGQSVNTTDSAVRLTHMPTGLVVSCQNERSQHQNKENAFRVLKAKLQLLAEEEREEKERKLKGDYKKVEWGSQIRSYFLYGNRLIKDHRSNFETTNIEAVLDGDLKEFIEAYLYQESGDK